MSDSYISIVPVDVDINKIEQLVILLIKKLTEKGYINDDFTPGENIESILLNKDAHFKDLIQNKLEIVKTRQVFDNGNNGLIEINCPHCSYNIIDENWIDCVEHWYSNSNQSFFICPSCTNKNDISKYNFNPNWGFGDLGFIFWNWSKFTDEFILMIEGVLESKVTIIYGRL